MTEEPNQEHINNKDFDQAESLLFDNSFINDYYGFDDARNGWNGSMSRN